MKKQSVLLLLVAFFLFVSCGKKADKSNNANNNVARVDPLVANPFITEQEVVCEEDICPESVAKIVVVDRETIRYCTGVLVAPDVMMTSASCLTSRLRVSGSTCRDNIFTYFATSSLHRKSYHFCEEILESDLNSLKDHALKQSDVAYYRLENSSTRKAAKISKTALSNQVEYELWTANYINDVDAGLRKSSCKALLNTYFNPFVKDGHASFVPFGDCHLEEASTGAPIFNHAGELVAIASSNVDRSIAEFFERGDLVDEKVINAFHASNAACLQFPWDNYARVLPHACRGPKKIRDLDYLRSEMLSMVNTNDQSFQDFSKAITSNLSPYFQWEMRVMSSLDDQKSYVYLGAPKCYVKLQDWIWRFSRNGRPYYSSYYWQNIPLYSVKIRFSSELQALYEFMDERQTKGFKISFYPKQLSEENFSEVKLSYQHDRGNFEAQYNVTQECQQAGLLGEYSY